MRNLLCIAIVFGAASVSTAHPGGLDANGGHNDRRNGGYHFHGGGGGGGIWIEPPDFDYGWVHPEPRTKARTETRTKVRTSARKTDRRTELANEFKPASSTSGNVPTDEEIAASKLRLAKSFLARRKLATAVRWLKECASKYPETAAGAEAIDLLRIYDHES